MKLPCRHIFALRKHVGMDLFDPSLCDRRWTIDYYKSKQKILLRITILRDISDQLFSSQEEDFVSGEQNI